MMPSSELESKLESKSSKDDNENDDDTHCDDQEQEHEHEHEHEHEQEQEQEHEEEEYDDEDEDEEGEGEQLASSSSSKTAIVIKCILACVLLYGALIQVSLSLSSSVYYANPASLTEQHEQEHEHEEQHLYYPRRRLSSTLTTHIVVIGDIIPSYMNTLITDLMERKKLFDDTPPEEIKYWFEYTGPLQKYFYRFSKSRAKADYFEGRDDSGVTSSRFTDEFLGSEEHNRMFSINQNKKNGNIDTPPSDSSGSGSGSGSSSSSNQHTMQYRLLENCLAMGSPSRPDTNTPLWKEWYGGGSGGEEESTTSARHVTYGYDRCRVLFTLNTVGAGRGTTMLWETSPPSLPNSQQPPMFQSEQESASSHLQRQLEEIDAMCSTNQIAARIQILVCEPINAKWTEWMDSLVPNCGGKISDLSKIDKKITKVDDRASPIQIVVVATVDSADTCHDLKSGFMERRTQDLILAPPFLGNDSGSNGEDIITNPAIKRTHPDLISSDDHDLYVGLKWTSLVTLRALHSFLQASADMAAGATSPINNNKDEEHDENDIDDVSISVSTSPSSPFLIPSFVRVSYVSEENAKVAKWRMHGDFFHPASWEICKDSFEVTWIDHSLSGPGGVNGLCYGQDPSTQETMKRRLSTTKSESSSTRDCGQWWIYMTELQMPNSPDIYANEITPPIVQGGSNFVWMVTERQRREIVKRQICIYEAHQEKDTKKSTKMEKNCPQPPQAVIPLGDIESFLINYTPNTALGKKHVKGRRPGYSREVEREAERELVRERKQLKGQEDIEKALFDYTIYPAALIRKDATLKAARARDAVLVAVDEKHKNNAKKSSSKTKKEDDNEDDNEDVDNNNNNNNGPKLIKSDYYDVTVTKPRQPVLGWCQSIARKGLCTLYSDYFRTSNDVRCLEACGMKKNFSKI